MAPFNPSDEVEPLAFAGMDRWGIPDGVVPEPSDRRVRDWRRGLNAATVAAKLVLPEDATVFDVAEAMLDRARDDVQDDLFDAYAVLCGGDPPNRPKPRRPPLPEDPGPDARPKDRTAYQEALAGYPEKLAAWEADLAVWRTEWTGGTPTRAQLDALPLRPLRAFCGWLQGAMSAPEASAAALSDSAAAPTSD